MQLGRPNRLEIKPFNEGTEFRFLLSFPSLQTPVEFETTARGAMGIMRALQSLQARHKIPIPDELRPSGPPTLTVVSGEDDDEPPSSA